MRSRYSSHNSVVGTHDECFPPINTPHRHSVIVTYIYVGIHRREKNIRFDPFCSSKFIIEQYVKFDHGEGEGRFKNSNV